MMRRAARECVACSSTFQSHGRYESDSVSKCTLKVLLSSFCLRSVQPLCVDVHTRSMLCLCGLDLL